ncbi:unnamed protein product [Larinioides sclopetarius]|uniref:Uncharacterized protein n=1 Tax=Larinioides sclopetarius TaxID=280406 RepID=A0AAV2BDX5_9ARAC
MEWFLTDFPGRAKPVERVVHSYCSRSCRPAICPGSAQESSSNQSLDSTATPLNSAGDLPLEVFFYF